MATDLTITWPGAVPVEAVFGQSAHTGTIVVADAAAMAAGFEIRPVHGPGVESAMKGAVPFSTDEDFSWAEEFDAAMEAVASRRGRPRKED